jgi:hypothetical protein
VSQRESVHGCAPSINTEKQKAAKEAYDAAYEASAAAAYLLARYPKAQDALFNLLQNGALVLAFRLDEHIGVLRPLLLRVLDRPALSLCDKNSSLLHLLITILFCRSAQTVRPHHRKPPLSQTTERDGDDHRRPESHSFRYPGRLHSFQFSSV